MTTENLTAPRSAAEKRELLARLLQKKAAQPRQFPLSFAQQRLWFLDRLQPGNAAYNISASFMLTEIMSPAVLAAALREVARRHQTLRTTFAEVDGQPVQVIAPQSELAVSMIDLRGLRLPVASRAVRGAGWALQSLAFDLSRGPLLRVALFQMRDGSMFIAASMHHIIGDGWSLGVLFDELRTLCAAFAAGRPSPLPELPIQYGDFALWQRQWLRGETLAAQVAYWRERLRGVTPLDLPTDRPRPAVQSFRGAGESLALAAEGAARLNAAAARSAVTPFMLLLALFQVLLHRYTGRDDLTVGVPVAGRNRRELEGLVGMFVNTLVLRADLTGDPAFAALLGRVKEAALGAFAHQDLPFEKLVEALQPERDTSRPPLFQVTFVLQNTPIEAEASLALAAGQTLRSTAKFDLTLEVLENPNGLLCTWEYNRDLFDAVTIRRLSGHFERLLTAVLAGAPERLSELPLLAPGERHQLLVEWAPPLAAATPAGTLHELFAEQARRRPTAPAVTCAGVTLSYGELAERADRLAGRLRRSGVGAETRVALCLERSLELPLAMLAVLKAGGAYVPIDPAYPAERKQLLLTDSGAAVLLTTAGLADDLPPGAARRVLLDAAEEEGAGEGESDVSAIAAALPESLAYVIYTSGSTGRPKGVLVPHAQVVRLFAATDPWFNFGPQDVWTLFHSAAFDFSVWEIWGALTRGGRLVVVPQAVTRAPEAYRELLREEGVTVLNQTPSAFYQLARADAESDGDLALRLVIFGGEALEPAALAPWLARHGEARPRLINMYGITETTVHVTYRPIAAADARRPARSPIGAPLPDLRLHLLGRGLEAVPIGVPGELCVGGAGLARGYLGRPELTAERFVPDPFGELSGTSSGTSGERLYRSGDLARRLPGGDVEYLGRIDQQVKVRGFRIELGEIEAEICRHPAVAQAVVVLDGTGDDRRLLAYTVPRPGAALEPAELREALRARLPEHMVPAAWIPLAALPLTAHGKVDRRALPRPERAAVAAAAYAPPSSHLERLIVGVWQELLRVERVGVHDNFFDLGGHSLLLVQAQSRLQVLLGRKISMIDLLSHSSVDSLARFLSREGDPAVPGEPGAAEGPAERSDEGKDRLRQLRQGGRATNLKGAPHE